MEKIGGEKINDRDKAEAMARASDSSHRIANYVKRTGDEVGKGNVEDLETRAGVEEEIGGIIHDLQFSLENIGNGQLPSKEQLSAIRSAVQKAFSEQLSRYGNRPIN